MQHAVFDTGLRIYRDTPAILRVNHREMNEIMCKQVDYLSYILRLWLARQDGETAWRASLQIVPTGHRLGFANLGELFDYLRQQMVTGGTLPGDKEDPANK